MMYGLFISLSYTEPNFDDDDPKNGPHIVLVDSEQDGVRMLVEKLEECGLVEQPSAGRYLYGDDVFTSLDDVLEAFQESLGASEYYHVYPVMNAEVPS